VRPPGEHPVFVSNNRFAAVAAAHSVDPDPWWTAYGAVIDLLAPRFSRYEPVRHAGSLMLGMLSSLERKNCWTISEHRGRETPYAFQHLLSRASWDADDVRDANHVTPPWFRRVVPLGQLPRLVPTGVVHKTGGPDGVWRILAVIATAGHR
jgi:hypothetical protein